MSFTQINVKVTTQLPDFSKQLRALRKEAEALVRGSPYSYVVYTGDLINFSAGTMSHFEFGFDDYEEILNFSNFKTSPRVYSKDILNGNPLPQRVRTAQRVGKRIFARKVALLNRKQAIDKFNKLSPMPLFSPKTGQVGRALNRGVTGALNR